MKMTIDKRTTIKSRLRGTKRLFFKLGSCSRTLGYIVNREFDNLSENHERALDPLAGGILQQGYQCGMIWGASMAAGAEAYKRKNGEILDPAIARTISATRHIMQSFENKAKSCDCYDITQCDWHSKWSIARYFVKGKVVSCYKLMDRWAPEAIAATHEGLSNEKSRLSQKCKSCASEVVLKMGGSEAEAVMASGWAGGVGLSGNACGALAAAIWMKTLRKCKEKPGKSFFTNPDARELQEKFYKETNYEILCREITGRSFETREEHTEFIEGGGCKGLIEMLAKG